jgi:hypothetical protein
LIYTKTIGHFMPINVKSGSVTVSETGGDSVVYAFRAGNDDTRHYHVLADTDLRVRRTCTVRNVPPRPNVGSPGGYTQARATITFREPLILANGKITVNTSKHELAYDIEASTALKTRLINAQAIVVINNPDIFTNGEQVA